MTYRKILPHKKSALFYIQQDRFFSVILLFDTLFVLVK